MANFTVEAVVHRSGGRTMVRTFNFINHAYDRRRWKAADIEPLTIDGFVEIPEGEYELTVILRNPKNDRTGRITRPVRLRRR